ncbi:lamin tail domain-containing protein [Candidatus Kaiserbacteria bacterium]|nr:lamin tail domain-containing protein [Candidatus Kaiserbacteria bacterium]
MARIILAATTLVIVPVFSHAQVVISEVMYDLAEGSDGGREWIEVYNESGAAIDLSEWKLFENSTNHGLKALSGSELAPGSYAIIADNPEKFKADYQSFTGLLFDSAFSLNNSGETLVLRCCGKDLADKNTSTYSSDLGGAGDGTSLSRSGSSFVPTDPTPGAAPGTAKAAPESVPETKSPPPAQKLPEPRALEDPEETTQVSAQTVTVLSESASASTSEMKTEEKGTPLPAAVQKQPAPKSQPTVEKPEEESAEDDPSLSDVQSEKRESANETQVAAAGVGGGSTMWWGGALFIILLGGGAAFAVSRMGKREWTIEEG